MKTHTLALLFLTTILGLNAQTNILDSLVHQNLQRKYILHLPPDYNPQLEHPLVVFLHGGSGSAFSAQNFTQFNPVSNAENFLIVYPEGFAPSGAGGFTWADGRGTSADNLGIDDVGFIDQLMETLPVEYAIDTNRIYLAGFSNGGFMTQRIACEMNDRLAAIASLGSTLDVFQITNCQPERPIPTLILTGTEDPLVPYNGGPMNGNVPDIVSSVELLAFWAENNQCTTLTDTLNLPDLIENDSSTITTYEFTNCNCEATVKHIRVNNGGHTWPGVEIPDYEIIAGQTNEDISASQEVWDFFNQFERCLAMTTATQELDKNNRVGVKVYPNPVGEILYLEAEVEIEQVEIWSVEGVLLEIHPVRIDQMTINLSKYQSGIYLVTVNDIKGKQYIQKFVKK